MCLLREQNSERDKDPTAEGAAAVTCAVRGVKPLPREDGTVVCESPRRRILERGSTRGPRTSL